MNMQCIHKNMQKYVREEGEALSSSVGAHSICARNIAILPISRALRAEKTAKSSCIFGIFVLY